MKITIFTSNQPRHIALINRLSIICDDLFAIQECNTVFPGTIPDFYKKSEIMREYFQNVLSSEKKIFDGIGFHKNNVKSLSIKLGDLVYIEEKQIIDALNSDIYIVFGSSYIKGWLADFLVKNGAINIHMGISPYYRGSSCNFWALYDHRPEYVGSTIHLLSKGLDSGAMLYHALPKLEDADPFYFTMKAVEAAQRSLVDRISSGQIFSFEPQIQDKSEELKYTRNSDFTDQVASEFLARRMDNNALKTLIGKSIRPSLLEPYYY